MTGTSLAASGAALLLLHFVAWRRRGRWWLAGAAVLALAWTAWIAEVLLYADERVAAWRWAPPDEDPGALLPAVGGLQVPRDLAALPAPGRTVVTVGDSFTAGPWLTTEQTWPRVLARALGPRVDRVVRVAVPGWNTAEEAVAYATLAAPLDPDVVVWMFVPNDLGPPAPYSESALVRELVRPPSGSRVLDRIRRLTDDPEVEARTTAAYRAVLGDRQRLDQLRDTLEPLVREVRGRGGRFVFVLHPLLHRLDDPPFRAEHARIAALARDAGAEVVDLLDLYAGREAADLWVAPWDHHPGADAHRLVGEALADALVPGGFPDSGPSRCELLPLPDVGRAELLAACAEPDGAHLLAAAEALAAATSPEDGWFGHRRVLGAELAAVASARAEAERSDAAAGLRRRAEAVVAAARATP